LSFFLISSTISLIQLFFPFKERIPMPDRVLTLRDLNRATLSRQRLLDRVPMPVVTAIEQLGGMQAQQAQPPYVGLWTRLKEFRREDLADRIADHTVIKATMIRATLHLVTAQDYVKFRTTIQPALAQASESIVKQRGTEFEIDQVLAMARQFIAEQPRSFAEITAMFEEQMPGIDVGSLRYTVRTHVPLVQVPNDSLWSYPGNPQFTLAEPWIGQPISTEDHLRDLLFRYLAAFGPATLADFQKWSGLGKLKEAIEPFKPELVIYRDEKKRELLDLPNLPLPEADTPAPVRFLPEFDNLLLAHQVRTRVIDEAYHKQVYLPGLRVAATFLVDGFVRGTWKLEKTKNAAAIILTPFETLAPSDRETLAAEAESLVRFVESGAKTVEVRFAD
jgi:hypothetical protein